MDKRFFWLSFYCRRLPSLLAAKRFDGASKAGCNLNCQSCTQISHSCKWISSQMTKSVSPFAIPTQMSRVLFLATIQSLTQFGPSTVRCEVPDHSSASPASDLAASKHLRHVYCQYLSISILGSTELAVLQCRSGYCTGEVNWKDWRNSVTQQEQGGCPKMGDIQLPRKKRANAAMASYLQAYLETGCKEFTNNLSTCQLRVFSYLLQALAFPGYIQLQQRSFRPRMAQRFCQGHAFGRDSCLLHCNPLW